MAKFRRCLLHLKKNTSHKPSSKKEKVLHYSFSSSFRHEILKRTNTVIILSSFGGLHPAPNFPYFVLYHWTGPSNVLFVGEFWHWMPKCLCVCTEHFYTLFCTSLSNIGHTSSADRGQTELKCFQYLFNLATGQPSPQGRIPPEQWINIVII